MKVQVSFTVEVNEAAWRDEYGVEDVRADVKTYVENATRDHLSALGLSA